MKKNKQTTAKSFQDQRADGVTEGTPPCFVGLLCFKATLLVRACGQSIYGIPGKLTLMGAVHVLGSISVPVRPPVLILPWVLDNMRVGVSAVLVGIHTAVDLFSGRYMRQV